MWAGVRSLKVVAGADRDIIDEVVRKGDADKKKANAT